MLTGTIVGSPKEGYATVKLPNGSTMTVATAGVTATGKSAAPAAKTVVRRPEGEPAAPGARIPATATKTVKAVVPELTDDEVDRRIALADKKAAAKKSAREAAGEEEGEGEGEVVIHWPQQRRQQRQQS